MSRKDVEKRVPQGQHEEEQGSIFGGNRPGIPPRGFSAALTDEASIIQTDALRKRYQPSNYRSVDHGVEHKGRKPNGNPNE